MSISNSNSKDTYSNLLYRSPVGTNSNNCWAYAIDHYETEQGNKLQPGELSGKTTPIDLSDCSDIVQRAIDDAKSMGWTLTPTDAPNGTCTNTRYHITVVLAPNRDYHWYRFHKHVLYRVNTPRSRKTIADEFKVPEASVHIPGDPTKANKGDLVLVRNANVWSHKRGLSEDGPLLKDACGKFIKDPATACRAYPGLNYSIVCKTFCLDKHPKKSMQ
jgi:hypothetical protein